MARAKRIIDANLALAAKRELKRHEGDRLYLRLLAIARAGDYPVQEVAQFLGVSRRSVWRWGKQFQARGVEGLRDQPKGHNPSKLQEKQKHQIARWLERGKDAEGRPIHWTLEKLQLAIADHFGIEISIMPLWLHLQRMGFRQLVPRPHHASANPREQERFKKKRQHWWRPG